MNRTFNFAVLLIFISHCFAVVSGQSTTHIDTLKPDTLPTIRTVDRRGQREQKRFPRFGQCQFAFKLSLPRNNGLTVAEQPNALKQRIYDCFETAKSEGINVLVLPELALSLPENFRREVLAEAKKLTKEKGMIIIAGSFYDDDRYNRLLVVGDGWIETGVKIRASRFEASPKAGEGMTPGGSLLVLKTVYGTFAIITCVDLISDDVQYVVRHLATKGDFDVLININYNPKSWEFLVEANSIVRRHPVFASITNVAHANLEDPKKKKECAQDILFDNGDCYGNTAVFSNLRTRQEEAPNNADRISADLPGFFTLTCPTKAGAPRSERLVAYDHLIAVVDPFRESMLIYDLNIHLTREPLTTNAPDQGYPPIRNFQIVDLKARVPSLK